ncbi:MAG: TRAP transporter small permease [Pseudomonadota bacterium]
MAATSLNTIGFAVDRLAQMAGIRVSGLPGYEDFVTLAVAVAALTFLPYCQVQRGHVQVDLLGRLLSPSWRFALDWAWTVTACALAVFLTVWLFYGMLEARADRVLSPVLAWPVWQFYLPGIISLALWALVSASQLAFERERR